MASQALKELVATIREQSGAASPDMTLEERRAAMEQMQTATPTPEDITLEDVDMAGVPGRWVKAPGVREDAVVLYFHGGGYVMGSLNTHQELMSRISRVCGVSVLGADYRLAPESAFPAAVEDALTSYQWLVSRGIAPEKMVFAGDSAGGGLTYATLASLRDSGQPLPAGAFTFSPWTDLTSSGQSMQSRAAADPMIQKAAISAIAALYLGDQDPTMPLISPVFADLQGLPPQLIQVGDAEVLLDDAVRIAENARAAGCEVSCHVFDEAFHVFQAMPQLPEAEAALNEVGAFVKSVVG